jgi:hypothetical protein
MRWRETRLALAQASVKVSEVIVNRGLKFFPLRHRGVQCFEVQILRSPRPPVTPRAFLGVQQTPGHDQRQSEERE